VHPELWLPAVQVTLPIVFTIAVAAWLNNKRIDDINKRFEDVNKHFDDLRADIKDMRADFKAILHELQSISKDHEKRIVTLEERTSPILRR